MDVDIYTMLRIVGVLLVAYLVVTQLIVLL